MGIMDRFKKEEKKTAAKAKKASAVKAEKKVDEKAAAPAANVSKGTPDVIVKPLVTEKAAVMQAQSKYAFVVAGAANKQQIAAAVTEMYGVAVLGVHVINNQGHRMRFGKGMGKRSDFKKAIVTLPKGSSIVVHAGV